MQVYPPFLYGGLQTTNIEGGMQVYPPRGYQTANIEEGEQVDHSIVEIRETTDERFKSTTIFKVHVGLRESNPAAYTPKLISIGPYHNKSPNLRSMEKYKRLYQQRFLNRNNVIDKESCIRVLETRKDEVLACYDDKESLDEDTVGNFSEIMLLDGCFLVEFIRESFEIQLVEKKDYQKIIDTNWMRLQVRRDIVVLENQLPFFVLTMLYDMTKRANEESFLYMVARTLSNVSPKKTCIRKSKIDSLNAEPFDHLLHMVHMLSCSSEEIPPRPLPPRPSEEIPDNSMRWNIPSATELYEAGVSFTKIGSVDGDPTDTTTLLDIKFENGLLGISWFVVEDSLETFLRNLIAYEQHKSNVKTYFSDYAHIMDQLINSPKDAKLLRESGIITNYMGDDETVAKIFNKLFDGVAVNTTESYFKEECCKLNQHCQKRWNKIMANLRRNYFQSVWAGTSTVAAGVLLILTTIQTILAFTGSVK